MPPIPKAWGVANALISMNILEISMPWASQEPDPNSTEQL